VDGKPHGSDGNIKLKAAQQFIIQQVVDSYLCIHRSKYVLGHLYTMNAFHKKH